MSPPSLTPARWTPWSRDASKLLPGCYPGVALNEHGLEATPVVQVALDVDLSSISIVPYLGWYLQVGSGVISSISLILPFIEEIWNAN